MPVHISAEEFEELVAMAIDSLPDEFAAALDNVAIVVEDEPDEDDLAAMGLGPDESDRLLGLYVGRPKTEQGHWDLVLPDKISIYRLALCDECDSTEELAAAVRKTVLHEIGHYFGLSDERLEELGWH